MLCSNTHHLNDYEHNQCLQVTQWELSIPEKREAVIEYAKKILRQDVVGEEFDWAMCEYIDLLSDDESYTTEFNEALDNWILKVKPTDELEAEVLWKICHSSLSAASEILYDIEFESLFDNLGVAIKEVMNND